MTGYTSGKISHDPFPWRHWPQYGTTDVREVRFERLADAGFDAVHTAFSPRPEYDNHNPVLATIRLTSSIAPVSWLDTPLLRGELPMAAYVPEHIDHARRVLEKLAALS